jgi:Fe-S-cluster containining protein
MVKSNMKNIFEKICKRCQGRCCKLNMMLTGKDLKKLKNKIDITEFKKYTNNIYVHWRRCVFLNEKKSCTLSEKLKPFDCRLFPLTFMYGNNKTKIFLNKKCPYADEVSDEWIKRTIKWLMEELESWTEEEKMTYTKLIKKHSSSKLFLLKEY